MGGGQIACPPAREPKPGSARLCTLGNEGFDLDLYWPRIGDAQYPINGMAIAMEAGGNKAGSPCVQ